MRPVDVVIADALGIAPGDVTDTLAYNSIPAWDSVGHVGLVVALEDEYGLTLNDDDIVTLTTVRAIRDLVQRATSDAGSAVA